MLLHRTFLLRALPEPGEDPDLINLSASSEEPVERGRFREILSHDHGAVSVIARAVLFNHDANQIIGSIAEGGVAGDRTTRFKVRLLPGATLPTGIKASDAVRSGALVGVSVGYSIDGFTRSEADGKITIRADKWTIREVSLTPIPADPTVGIGRSLSDDDQAAYAAAFGITTPQARTMTTPADPAPSTDPSDSAVRAELESFKRADRLRTLATSHGVDITGLDLRSFASDEAGITALLERKAKVTPAVTPAGTVSPVQVTVDAADKVRNAVTDAILYRGGATEANATDGGMRRHSLRDLIRRSARLGGVPGADDLAGDDLMDYALRQGQFKTRAYSASDFPNLLANAAQKFVLNGFTRTGSTWRQWTRLKMVPDFKAVTAAAGAMGLFGQQPAEGMPLPNLNLTEASLTVQAKMGGASVVLTRQLLQNDDLGEIARKFSQIGAIADQTIEYAAIQALLNATWTGAVTSGADLTLTATAPEAAIGKAVADFLGKTDPAGIPINAIPRIALVTPTMLVNARKVLFQAQASPDLKVFSGQIVPLVVPYLISTAVSANASADNFYLVADPAQVDGVIVALVDEAPRLIEMDTAGVPGQGFRAEFPWGVAVNGTYGLQKVTKA